MKIAWIVLISLSFSRFLKIIPVVMLTLFISVEYSFSYSESSESFQFNKNSHFPRCQKMKPQIDFWKKVFTTVPSTKYIIHDNWYLGIIYEIVDIEGISENEADKAVSEAKQKYAQMINGVINYWGKPYKMTNEERRVYLLFLNENESSYYPFREASDRIRAQAGCADKFKEGLIRSGRYNKIVKDIFLKKGLPEELIYLPMIESSYNPRAVSHAGAAGMWQFMKGTGKAYGLRINRLIDERRDPIKATIAAANLLADNYRVLESWPIAVTAYNYGRRGMMNAVDEVGSNNMYDIAEKFSGKRFSFASRNFYPELLAAIDVCSQYKKYFGEIAFEPPISNYEITLSRLTANKNYSRKIQKKFVPKNRKAKATRLSTSAKRMNPNRLLAQNTVTASKKKTGEISNAKSKKSGERFKRNNSKRSAEKKRTGYKTKR